MKNSDAFSSFHPAVNLLFFLTVFIFCAACSHPVCTVISFASAAVYYIYLKGSKATAFLLKGMLPLFLLTVIINPVFSHEGKTFLYLLPNGNYLTLESILYGISGGITIITVIIWFAVFSTVFTTDKFVYLFGKILPALSLLLSVTLRFVPRFKRQLETVKETQKAFGIDTENGTVLRRIKNALKCFSAVITLSLENSVQVSDSMKGRGWGLKGRTSYSNFTFESRDKTAFCFILFCDFALAAALLSGALFWRFYPDIRGTLTPPLTIFCYVLYALFCFMPVYFNKKEDLLWKRLASKI